MPDADQVSADFMPERNRQAFTGMGAWHHPCYPYFAGMCNTGKPAPGQEQAVASLGRAPLSWFEPSLVDVFMMPASEEVVPCTRAC